MTRTMNSVALLLLAGTAVAVPLPKMVQTPVTPGTPLGPPDRDSEVAHIFSNFTVSTGKCFKDTPYQTTLYGMMGDGAVGILGEIDVTIDYLLEDGDPIAGAIYLRTDRQPNFFGLEAFDRDPYYGFRFEYESTWEPYSGRPVVITCSEDTEIIVIANDAYDMVVDATVTASEDGTEDEIEMVGDEALEDLVGEAIDKKEVGKGKGEGKGNGKASRKFKVRGEGGTSKKMVKVGRDNVAMIDAIVEAYPGGPKVKRTLIHDGKKTFSDFKKPRGIDFECCKIDNDGDIEITFPGLSSDGLSYRVDARLGVSIHGADAVGVVDVLSFIVPGNDDTLTVDGGWIRKFLDETPGNIEDDDFEVKLLEVKVTDPNNEYRKIGVKGVELHNQIPHDQRHHRRKLTAKPSDEEKDMNTEGMTTGKRTKAEIRGRRKLRQENSGLRRELQCNAKRILVHGYCSGNTAANPAPWPMSHFDSSSTVRFLDPANGDGMNNWSNDEFAQKIDEFAEAAGINECSIIAHSQGGLASLHLYSYYWSCLDNSSGGRKIQSVGSPYKGTNLAGNLAAIGSLFGTGCGFNNDLTNDGATAWLANIPSWARSAVYFYRTRYEDNWWSYDYCHIATDLIVSGDDDGTTSVSKGYLTGGNDMGVAEGFCHTASMHDPAQYNDYSRNSVMNSNAALC